MNESTTIPMASITKLFSGVVAMKAFENKTLSLEEPIKNHLKNESILFAIKVKHVLSHSSQGDVGKHFYFSNRFGWITNVIQQSYALPIEDVVQNEIIAPLGLKNTYPLTNEASIKNDERKIVQPYILKEKSLKAL